MDAVDLLSRTEHNFHPAARGEPWGLEHGMLSRLAELAPAGGTSLETGFGDSTVVLINASARHIAIGPDPDEPKAIIDFCATNGIDVSGFDARIGGSDRVLPTLDIPPLDLVLIDGQHAFPAPFLDWYYTADQLRKGGLVVVDDIPIRTGAVLKDFLDAEPEWELRELVGRAAVFEKLIDGPVTGKWWAQQPWCHPVDRPPSPLNRVRAKVRLRHRLRTLAHRD